MGLRNILHTPENLHEDWKVFSKRGRDTYLSMTPSVTLKDSQGILITDFADVTGIFDNTKGVPFFKSVEISQELSTYGTIEINISGTIFGMNKFISSGAFLRLFGMYNSLELHFGWGEKASLNNSARYDPLFTHIPCNMITYKLKYNNAWSYDFSMTLQSNLSYFERNLDLSMLGGNPFTIDDFKYYDTLEEVDANNKVIPNGIKTKVYYSTLYSVMEKIKKAVNEISITKDNKRVFKEIKFEYGRGTKDIPDNAFAFPSIPSGSRSLGDLKIHLGVFASPDIFKGSLKMFIQNVLDQLRASINSKVTFFINEDADTTVISFYNINEEYDKERMEKSLVVELNTQNSVVSGITFNYEKPLYALNMLRSYKDGKYFYGGNQEAANQNAKQAGFNFQVLVANSIDKVTKSFSSRPEKGQDQLIDPSANKEESKNENLQNSLLQFVNLTADLDTLGFCGFHPGQGIIITNDMLFAGKYIIESVTHTLSSGSFSTTNELRCLDASETMKQLFT